MIHGGLQEKTCPVPSPSLVQLDLNKTCSHLIEQLTSARWQSQTGGDTLWGSAVSGHEMQLIEEDPRADQTKGRIPPAGAGSFRFRRSRAFIKRDDGTDAASSRSSRSSCASDPLSMKRN
jgi:hypothetical protein